MTKDLVCGMDVDEKTAKYKTIYQSKYYYFCAPGCKKTFEANPQKYIGGVSSEKSGHSCGCGGHC
jgi:YHS domain-containing protein